MNYSKFIFFMTNTDLAQIIKVNNKKDITV